MSLGSDLRTAAVAGIQEADARDFYEIVDGKVVENPPMGAHESVLASLLHDYMGLFARDGKLGQTVSETLFLIDPGKGLKRRPDIAFVSAERWPLRRRVPRTEAWEVVPDLAIEVISLSNTADQVDEKIEDYFHSNVRQVWVIYPGTSKVYVYDSPTSVRILQVGEDLDGGSLLPGFRLPLAVLFGQEDEDQGPEGESHH
jgi:Uma2 family endonuclease